MSGIGEFIDRSDSTFNAHVCASTLGLSIGGFKSIFKDASRFGGPHTTKNVYIFEQKTTQYLFLPRDGTLDSLYGN